MGEYLKGPEPRPALTGADEFASAYTGSVHLAASLGARLEADSRDRLAHWERRQAYTPTLAEVRALLAPARGRMNALIAGTRGVGWDEALGADGTVESVQVTVAGMDAARMVAGYVPPGAGGTEDERVESMREDAAFVAHAGRDMARLMALVDVLTDAVEGGEVPQEVVDRALRALPDEVKDDLLAQRDATDQPQGGHN